MYKRKNKRIFLYLAICLILMMGFMIKSIKKSNSEFLFPLGNNEIKNNELSKDQKPKNEDEFKVSLNEKDLIEEQKGLELDIEIK
jgi:hypothetical protein